MAHSGPHIQLAVGPQRQVHDRIVHRSPDVALVIGHRQQRSQRASALDLQRHAGPVLLQGVAHHGDRSQRPAQRRRGHRQSLVDLTGALCERPGGNCRGLDMAILGDGPDQLIAHCTNSCFILV